MSWSRESDITCLDTPNPNPTAVDTNVYLYKYLYGKRNAWQVHRAKQQIEQLCLAVQVRLSIMWSMHV